ncbi:putative neutral sphingomyelinase [Trichoplusia ni]|uniref:sphingomyelin phosphodiesterase n=1 Tax=Trichoplusia ni TaxID=7111 RepID=A0A7E5X4L4_TRINI|nr:putative neutral sphingomyelinase [Trichoplusia ni]
MEFTVNVFTLNCWGIPVVSKNRKERFEAIAKYLQESSHTIVCLQEVWSEFDYLNLKDSLKGVLPYSHYFYSGVNGSGLCVFSKWMIQDVFFHQWTLNGYIHKIHHGDWFGGKGVGLCRIKHGNRLINVYCTHLHAEYHEDDIYLAHRVLQAHSTAELVNLTTAPADISILAGDLNATPGDISYKIITQLPKLIDPFCIEHKQIDFNNLNQVGTSDNANNSYSDPRLCKTNPEGKRIDHILYKVNAAWEAEVVNLGNPLPTRVPNKEFSYSDHNAVSVQIHLKPSDNKTQKETSLDDAFDETATQAIKVCEEAMVNISKSKTMFLTVGGLILMFLIGTVGYWPNLIFYDIIKLFITGLSFYYLIMGTVWNNIEMNSLKAGLSALENFCRTRISDKGESVSFSPNDK